MQYIITINSMNINKVNEEITLEQIRVQNCVLSQKDPYIYMYVAFYICIILSLLEASGIKILKRVAYIAILSGELSYML